MTTVKFDYMHREWINDRPGYAPYLQYTYWNNDSFMVDFMMDYGCHDITRDGMHKVTFDDVDYPFPKDIKIEYTGEV